jgi:hypothetical protein
VILTRLRINGVLQRENRRAIEDLVPDEVVFHYGARRSDRYSPLEQKPTTKAGLSAELLATNLELHRD